MALPAPVATPSAGNPSAGDPSAAGLSVADTTVADTTVADTSVADTTASAPVASGRDTVGSAPDSLSAPAGAAAAPQVAAGPAIRDPLYELLIGFVWGDSLGTWDQAHIRRYVERSGRKCMLPYQQIVRIVRRPALPAEAERRRGAQVSRIWEITLQHPVHVPMPYSFLGYHPGSLLASGRFVASEWRLDGRTLYIAHGPQVERFHVDDTVVFRLDRGYLALDVDAWLDKLLGSLLDDFYTDGFALCRYRGQIVESSMITTRDGRLDYGEFDLQRDRVIEHIDKLARALGYLSRPWVTTRPGSPQRAWPRPEEAS